MSAIHNYPIYTTENQMQDYINNAKKKMEKKFKKSEYKMEKRFNSKLISNMKSMNNELQKSKNETNKKFTKMQERYDAKLKSQADDFTGKLTNFRSELKNDIKIVTNSVNDINSRLKSKYDNDKTLANQWLEMLKEQINFIKEHYNWELFAKTEVGKLERDYKNAQTNYRNNQFEATIATCQGIFSKSEEVEEDIMLKTLEWENLYSIAEGKLKVLQEYLKNNKIYRFEGQNENGIAAYDDIDVDYWGNGEFANIVSKVKKEEENLNDNINKLTIENLASIIKSINTKTTQSLESVKDAVVNFRLNIDKQDVQEVVADKLEKLGFHIIENFWENDDDRKKNVLILENASNEKIMISLDKTEEDDLDLKWETNIKNKNTREERVKELTKTINKELNQDVDLNQLKAPVNDQPVAENLLTRKRFIKS